jgi:hypothetical protein
MKFSYRSWAVASALIGLTTLGSAAQAAFVQEFEGSDCAGEFGDPPNCVVPAFPESGIPEPTPLILKIDLNDDGSVAELTFGVFDSIDGSEFTLDFGDDGNTGTGTWVYTPGEGDPLIGAYVAKGGDNFNLFSNDGDPNSGDYFTPNNGSGNPAGLSHITFYDTHDAPVPATLALLGFGLFGLSWMRRNRRS